MPSAIAKMLKSARPLMTTPGGRRFSWMCLAVLYPVSRIQCSCCLSTLCQLTAVVPTAVAGRRYPLTAPDGQPGDDLPLEEQEHDEGQDRDDEHIGEEQVPLRS